ncbi:MAG: hypothetical protein DMG44_09950 [Acidobacteria bacterium]|nr:MAG: hypothetical protein DMG44_09950 [Acidobacteriota bacterium]
MFLLCPQEGRAWGRSGHRLVVNKAIDTLPPEIRWYFESNRPLLLQHVTDPLDEINKLPAERRNHFIALDKYGRFPFAALPRVYKAAVTKFTKPKLDANGLLPWQIGVYSEKLTEAMKTGKWEEAKLYAAILANYVAEAHDPFNTTDNFDGRLSGQPGINERFGSALIDRYSSFFPMRPNDAIFIDSSPCGPTMPSLSMILQIAPLMLASVPIAGWKRFFWPTATRAAAQIPSPMSITTASTIKPLPF